MMCRPDRTLDERRHECLRHFPTLLSRWRGGRVTMHELTVSHRTLILHVERPGVTGGLKIDCIGPVEIRGPISWDDCEFAVTADNGETFLVRDAQAGVEIRCERVEVSERQQLGRPYHAGTQSSAFDHAREVIFAHGIGRDGVPSEQAVLPQGFLGCLRPFTGLREENFLALMDAVAKLSPKLRGKSLIDCRLVYALWEIPVRTRLIALDPDSPLQRNRLLSSDDTAALRLWVQCLELAVSRLLRGDDPAAGLEYYREQSR